MTVYVKLYTTYKQLQTQFKLKIVYINSCILKDRMEETALLIFISSFLLYLHRAGYTEDEIRRGFLPSVLLNACGFYDHDLDPCHGPFHGICHHGNGLFPCFGHDSLGF